MEEGEGNRVEKKTITGALWMEGRVKSKWGKMAMWGEQEQI
jgi:hypothetical protein